MKPCGLLNIYRCLNSSNHFSLYRNLGWRQQTPPKRQSLFTNRQDHNQEEFHFLHCHCESLTSQNYQIVADVEFRLFNEKWFWTECSAGHTERDE